VQISLFGVVVTAHRQAERCAYIGGYSCQAPENRLPDVTHGWAIAGMLLRLDHRSVVVSGVADPLSPETR
jgi:hypothetical protein